MQHLESLLFKKRRLKQYRLGLTILAIADTHGYFVKEEIEPFINEKIDICFFLGDVFPDDITIIKKYISSDIPMIGILGNHDDWNLLEKYNITNVHGKVENIKGINIAGIQGSLRYKDSDYPLITDDESCQIASSMQAADILISHDCPKHQHGRSNFAHSGLQGITEYCIKNSIPVHLYGHHHVNKETYMTNGTRSICTHRIQLLKI